MSFNEKREVFLMKAIKILGVLAVLFILDINAMRMSPKDSARFQQYLENKKHVVVQPEESIKAEDFIDPEVVAQPQELIQSEVVVQPKELMEPEEKSYGSAWEEDLDALPQEKNWSHGFPTKKWMKTAIEGAKQVMEEDEATEDDIAEQLRDALAKVSFINPTDIDSIEEKFLDQLDDARFPDDALVQQRKKQQLRKEQQRQQRVKNSKQSGQIKKWQDLNKKFNILFNTVGIGWVYGPSVKWQKDMGNVAIELILLNNTPQYREDIVVKINQAIDRYVKTLWWPYKGVIAEAKKNIFSTINRVIDPLQAPSVSIKRLKSHIMENRSTDFSRE